MKRIFLIISILVINVYATAQTFAYRAELPKVDSSGYYHIYLTPEITSKLNYKFSDIRLFDKKNNEIPYIRLSDDEIFKTAPNRPLNIIENSRKKQKRYTQVIIENKDGLKITNLVIIVSNHQNSEAWINTAGSNDKRTWNVLKDHNRYMPEYSDSATAEIRMNDLPETVYKYYRILIYDYDRTVFNVQKVLNYDISQKNIEFVRVMNPIFSQDDTSDASISTIQISFKEPQYIDKIQFIISSPASYIRKGEINKKDSTSGKKIKLKFYDQNQKDFYLCSDSSNILLLSRYYAQNLFLIVYNNDDKPIKIKDIIAYQRKEYIVAYLEKNQKYHISFGNRNVPLPIYDLKFFMNEIPVNSPEITVYDIQKNKIKQRKEKKIMISAFYLWIVFGIVVLILTAISIKMFVISKNNKSENEENEEEDLI